MSKDNLIIDLCSGGGIIAEAFHDSVGVDIERRSLEYYPGMKVLGSSTATPFRDNSVYYAHGSPPCQAFSVAASDNRKNHEDIVDPTRVELKRIAEHYSIENVPLAPIDQDLMLCSSMFGLPGVRHRIFELSFDVPQLKCKQHQPIWRKNMVKTFERGLRTKAHFAHKKGSKEVNQQLLGCRPNLPAFVSGEGVSPRYMEYILRFLGNPKPSLEDWGF